MSLNSKLGYIGASSDEPTAGVAASRPHATNGTWANFIAGATTSDTAFAGAGYLEFPGLDAAGAAVTLRVPCFKV